MMLGQTYARLGDKASAERAAAKAEAAGRTDPVVLRGLSFLYGDILGEPGRAAAYEAQYAVLAPQDRGAWTRASKLALAARMYPEALAAAKKALAENRYDEDAYFNLAQVHLVTLDFSAALKVLEDGRRSFDKSAQLELAYGVALYGQRRFPEAFTSFLRTIELAPDVQQPYVFLGRILEHAGDRLTIVTARFADYEKRHPESALGYLLHGRALAVQLPPTGYPPLAEQAQALVERAVAFDDKNAEAHYELGCLLERKRDFANAAKHLEQSVALSVKLPEAHYHLSRVYERLGRRDDAASQRALHAKLAAEQRHGRDASMPPPDPRLE